ncbi:serine hydrolase domain-containing protein [Plebeiibacterium marinum]|uniref:Beta-lactamase family protein n=1 Tax=Plebeiibacterium marinum TaxID=2992111 RepID=A0AAE3SJV3_9BACT|nr:serine hydrolase [Plebeiobacterium marinum]MCW3806150.1 beta-lactamase family protein [Plebeiobacterium marinum]
MRRIIVFLIVLSSISCKTKTDCSYQVPIDKKDGLKVASIKQHNLNEKVFHKVNNDICKGVYGNIHSVLVIHKNELIIEQYYNGWNPQELHFLASTTKSFSAILTGIAIEQGKIDDVNQLMVDYFPEYPQLKEDGLKKQITIKNLLNNTSGFKWDEQSLPVNDPNNMGAIVDRMDDWLKASLELAMDTVPGTKYEYSGPNNIIIGEIIKKATGQNIAEFANDNLLKPLGIEEYSWYAKNDIYDVGGGLKLKSRDIAKYGLLHLNKGNWNGNQIVSSKWMDEIFNPYIEIQHPLYSCCQWQMVKTEFGFNSWFIPGNGGQIINVVPDLDLVIVINADNRKIPIKKRMPLEYLIKDLTRIHPEMQNS